MEFGPKEIGTLAAANGPNLMGVLMKINTGNLKNRMMEDMFCTTRNTLAAEWQHNTQETTE